MDENYDKEKDYDPDKPYGKDNPQNAYLVTDKNHPQYQKLAEGRARYNEWQVEQSKRRQSYRENLEAFRKDQMDRARHSIETGEMASPMEMLLQQIQHQQLVVNDDKVVKNSRLYKSERELLFDMTREYAKAMGAYAPNAQSVEITVEESEKLTPEELQAELIAKLKDITPEDET